MADILTISRTTWDYHRDYVIAGVRERVWVHEPLSSNLDFR